MNNKKQKLQFIRSYHPDLYKKLEEKVSDILNEDWVPSSDDVVKYNAIVKDYCKDYNLSLQRQLSF